MEGATGRVVVLGSAAWSHVEDDFDSYFDDEPDEAEDEEQETSAVVIAGSLASFIDRLQHYLVARCMLASAGSRIERTAIRDDLESSLPDDGTATDMSFWTAVLRSTD
ncbi:hypothetical protein [Streptomyces nigra]|uniref:hypothetical protein n=1 Tax=Streptomyces nigra TaxID=1827580 RepID=UPI0036285E63